MKIKNGVDTYLFDQTQTNKKHEILTRKEIGTNSFDMENEDYPWSQFQDGIWYGANRKQLLEHRMRDVKNVEKNSSRIYRFLCSHPTLLILIKSFVY